VTPAETQLWNRILSRASRQSGEIARELLKAYRIIREQLSDAQLARLIEDGRLDAVIEAALPQRLLDSAFMPARDTIRNGIIDSVNLFAKDIPLGTRGIGVAFDSLSPYVIRGIRELESRVITTLEAETRETLRAFVENGLRDGIAPRAIARQVRSFIGLAPNQLQEVENFRAALEGRDGRDPFGYKLRDKRFDRTIEKGELSAEQIEKMTEIYRQKKIAWNAEVNARTAALDAQKLAQKLSWQAAIDQGIVDRDRLMKRWVGVMDSRERPEHVAMERETVPFDAQYSNGEDIPGSSTFNCRCISAYFLAP
jgi:hypothetical protein